MQKFLCKFDKFLLFLSQFLGLLFKTDLVRHQTFMDSLFFKQTWHMKDPKCYRA